MIRFRPLLVGQLYNRNSDCGARATSLACLHLINTSYSFFQVWPLCVFFFSCCFKQSQIPILFVFSLVHATFTAHSFFCSLCRARSRLWRSSKRLWSVNYSQVVREQVKMQKTGCPQLERKGKQKQTNNKQSNTPNKGDIQQTEWNRETTLSDYYFHSSFSPSPSKTSRER